MPTPQRPDPAAGTEVEARCPHTQDADTIAAIATAPGQAGIGVIRVSGRRALAIGEHIGGAGLIARQAHYRSFRDGAGELIDSGLLLYFPQPGSFTGEDVVEFQGHGGPVVLQMMLDQILRLGARLARPGEFTERAYLNDKLDLVQAEAVADVIAGSSEAAVRGANRSLSGLFSDRVHHIDRQVVDLRLFVEAAMDFPDEDIDLLADGQVTGRIEQIIAAVAQLRDDCAQGVILRDGVRLALIGAPNVGKSSLLNRLVGDARAIVTDVPGTTRDLVRAELNLSGLAVEIVDTAGLRTATDAAEAEGVRRALTEAEQADIVILIQSVTDSDWNQNERSVDEFLDLNADGRNSKRLIRILNKIDLDADPAGLVAQAESRGMLAVSAETGLGVEQLRAEIQARAGVAPHSNLFTARKRHLVALEAGLLSAEQALDLTRGPQPAELIAEELKAVHTALGEILGEMSSDALLGEIFSHFCIGK